MVLCELKCCMSIWECFSSPKVCPYYLSSFPNYEKYKWKHSKHLRNRKYSKKEGHLGWANWNGSTLKGQFQNKIGFSYLDGLGVGLI